MRFSGAALTPQRIAFVRTFVPTLKDLPRALVLARPVLRKCRSYSRHKDLHPRATC